MADSIVMEHINSIQHNAVEKKLLSSSYSEVYMKTCSTRVKSMKVERTKLGIETQLLWLQVPCFIVHFLVWGIFHVHTTAAWRTEGVCLKSNQNSKPRWKDRRVERKSGTEVERRKRKQAAPLFASPHTTWLVFSEAASSSPGNSTFRGRQAWVQAQATRAWADGELNELSRVP